ncbi:uncharacterized protein BT62DRAFT_1075133 [Guyanagaster necrorhizus]|uniref:Uncharacterized protein n=1 Tax=Guyanagaster necrorhizus TaxID=856835 RepID=A0A9P7VWM6_9AGAR|nr:uncharacterized protein BT62DRAFT_1075133 [Guyanagaster necrorhizus MCA 3950]KAG7447795.1 hypothetical protein BT62DRAFT_1075133 [Guyanagaster necrorhizus MCA 3950]
MFTNPLHPTILNSNRSVFSALGPAIIGTSDSSLPRNWKCLPQVPISQCEALVCRHPQSPIIFEMRGVKQKGISVQDLITRGPAEIPRMLVGGNAIYLRGGMKQMYIRFQWLGYEHLNFFTEIKVDPSQGIPLAVLAQELGRKINSFYSVAQYSFCSNEQWRMGARNIRLEQLILLSMWNTHENWWQAEIAIAFPGY